MTLLPATSELAVAAWVLSIPGLPVNGCSSTLPAQDQWSDKGWVTVAVVGGAPGMYAKISKPLIQIDCWTVAVNKKNPPWGQANVIAEIIKNFCVYDRPCETVTLPSGFNNARVVSAYAVTEPRRIKGDAANVARYQFDVQFLWTSS